MHSSDELIKLNGVYFKGKILLIKKTMKNNNTAMQHFT